MITVRGRGSMETGQGSISSALCHWVLYVWRRRALIIS